LQIFGFLTLTGGEGVSQSPLKDQVFLTFLGQNPPFELHRKLVLRLQSLHEIHGGSSKCCPSVSVGGGQQGWLAFAPEGKAPAHFVGSSQYFQWDWDARKTAGTFQLAHSKQRDSAAACYKLLGASFAQH
jgi:hypothetical protein